MRWLVVLLCACGRIGFDPLGVPGGDDTGPAVRSTISAGEEHACVVRTDGAVWCWGQDINGELGDGAHDPVALPQQVSGLPPIVAIESGFHHMVALAADGAVWCWGTNDYGQCGVMGSAPVGPTKVPLPRPALSVSAGGYHTCAVLDDNTVACWGKNIYGEVGHDPPEEFGPITIVTDQVTAVTTGTYHTCAIRAGTVVCWGRNEYGQLGNATNNNSTTPVVTGVTAVSISSGPDHTCAVDTAGRYRCWGGDDEGQLGDDTYQDRSSPTAPSSFSGITRLRAGFHHTCAVRDDGSVWCWGGASHGEHGYGGYSGTGIPRQTMFADIDDVALGTFFTCGLTRDGGVECTGRGSMGQLGNGQKAITVPTRVPLPGAPMAVFAGRNHLCVPVGAARDLYCWGKNDAHQVSTSNDVAILTPFALPVAGLDDIAPGQYHTCALAGAVYCWGENSAGQLGFAGTNDGTPALVSSIPTALEISAGDEFTCARLMNGSVQCFGHNNAGQLGDGGGPDTTTPTVIAGGASDITTGDNHVCKIDGTQVMCWGDNSVGQIGNGRMQAIELPVLTSPAIASSLVRAGGNRSCLRSSANSNLYCWGYNEDGNLGIADNLNHDQPQLVIGNVFSASVGAAFGCALTSTDMECWGDNSTGQLANGTTARHGLPAVAATTIVPTFSQMDVGDAYGCGVSAGNLYCWGDNEWGQLGLGTRSGSLVPGAVALP